MSEFVGYSALKSRPGHRRGAYRRRSAALNGSLDTDHPQTRVRVAASGSDAHKRRRRGGAGDHGSSPLSINSWEIPVIVGSDPRSGRSAVPRHSVVRDAMSDFRPGYHAVGGGPGILGVASMTRRRARGNRLVMSSVTSRAQNRVMDRASQSESSRVWTLVMPIIEGVKRACGAWAGRVTPVNIGHSSPPVSPRKSGLTWGHVV